MSNATYFILQIDRCLSDLRKHLLGLDAPLEGLLPRHLSLADTDTKAGYIARKITFGLAYILPEEDLSALSDYKQYIQEMIRYVLSETADSGHDFANLVMLAETPPSVRRYLLDQIDDPKHYPKLFTFEANPLFHKQLEEAIVAAQNQVRLKRNYRMFRELVRNFL